MRKEILESLQARHEEYERQYDIAMPGVPITLSQLLQRLGFQGSDVPVGFHDALEELQERGYITDLSTANGGFGRSIGTDGDVAYSNGAKIVLN